MFVFSRPARANQYHMPQTFFKKTIFFEEYTQVPVKKYKSPPSPLTWPGTHSRRLTTGPRKKAN